MTTITKEEKQPQRAPRRARMSKTSRLTQESAIDLRKWVHIDAKDQVLGRLATRIATLLLGKHKPEYTPHVDAGDYVVVTNAKNIRLTGKKWKDKVLRHHTGYFGHLISQTAAAVHARHPTSLLRRAVTNMLPKSILGRHMVKKLKIFAGPEHTHQAQNPTTMSSESP